jgi:hypothetical protein
MCKAQKLRQSGVCDAYDGRSNGMENLRETPEELGSESPP